jgi:glycosyltransferase involved in cell wall biosynthesis
VRVLFVCSGNSVCGISPIIINQASALTGNLDALSIDFFPIVGKGIRGYAKNISLLKSKLKGESYDIVHAHYSLSAFAASLAGAKPLIVSLMGSDVKASYYYKLIIKLFQYIFSWKVIIVKSEDMKRSLNSQNAIVIPNGVSFNRFFPMNKEHCRENLNWNPSKKHLLFTSNPNRKEKNYVLTKQAIELLNDKEIELHSLVNVPNEQTPIWYNAADVVILTSLWEGSPNAIKEAMACNRPIVSTNVGDVSWLLGDLSGCFLTEFNAKECAESIDKAIQFSLEKGETCGRERLIELGLENSQVAETIASIYMAVIKILQ